MRPFVLTALGLLAGCQAAAPSIKADETRVDLGSLETEQMGHARFELSNTGSKTLSISRVDTGCGCSKPNYPRSVPPGKPFTVEVSFQPQLLWAGPRTEHVYVFSNDPQRPRLDLSFTVNLKPPIEIQPMSPAAFSFTPGRASVHEIRLRPRDSRWKIVGPASGRLDRIEARLQRGANADTLLVRFKPTRKAGSFREIVDIPTNHPGIGVLHVAIIGNPGQGPIAVPGWLSRNALAAKSSDSRIGIFRVKGVDRNGRVQAVRSSDKALSFEIAPDLDPNATRVTVIYKGGWRKGTHKGIIQVLTSDPRFPTLEVPFEVQHVF